MCIIRDAARRSPRVVAKVPRARFSIGVAVSSWDKGNEERKMKRDEREREREKEGGGPRESNREDGEFAHADNTRKLALENYEDHDNADDEVNDVDDPVREE